MSLIRAIVAGMSAVLVGACSPSESTGPCPATPCRPGFVCVDGACIPGGEGGADADADVEIGADADADGDADPDTGADADGDGDGDGTDGETTPLDSDGDTIPDSVEGAGDTDSDTIPDYLDTDSDNDTIPDSVEAGDADPRTAPVDTDSDTIPDYLDTDSDNDTILDRDEGLADPDGDGRPAYRDLDSDGDLILDSMEAGDADPATPPRDSDGDGVPDFLDTDSDDDYISDLDESIADTDSDTIPDYLDTDSDQDTVHDRLEAGDADLATPPRRCDDDPLPDFRDTDSDNDGVGDGEEWDRGLDPCNEDSDGDGVSDLIELTYGSDPRDPLDSPLTDGNFVFVVPYRGDPRPWQDTLVFATALQKADVYFLVDCTGSMGGEIAALRASIRTTVIPGIVRAITDSWTGVGRFEDYPVSPFGSSGASDTSYRNVQSLTSDPARAQAAADTLGIQDGGDWPESQVPALWTVATADPGRTLPRQPAASCPAGAVGYPCFRGDAVRVIVLITDADFHNGPGGDFPYTATVGGVTPPGYPMAVAELTSRSIKVIGVNSGTARRHLEQLARDTATVDIHGNALVFHLPDSGVGLGDQIVNAINSLARNVPIRVDATLEDASDDPGDPGDLVDAVAAFVDYRQTNTTGRSIWDARGGVMRVCTSGLTTADSDADARPDYYPRVLPGTPVCWDIRAKRNETVPALPTPQIFRASIRVVGDRITPLDSRDIYFLVPPVIQGAQ
ncbi:MAG: hypothetical protein QME96_10140 [Myxococcota bacterium]|nr:hypothetical protein [Myxococcota bacterium]